MAESTDRLLDRAADLLEAGREVALCLLVRARGSTPAAAGALMLVDDAAGLHGTIGGGCVEAEVRRTVIGLMGERRTGLLHFKLDHDYGWDDGLICGGAIDIAVAYPDDPRELRTVAEAHRRRESAALTLTVHADDDRAAQRYVLDLPPRPRLLIAGAGHIGGALAVLARQMEFDVTIFDDRPDLVGRLPDDVRSVVGPIDKEIVRAGIDEGTYIVIVTRGHRHDEQVLEAVVNEPAAYIGMIGSRRKVKLIFDDLKERGVTEERLARVNAPIGLDIGSITVNEVALSIAAQLVAVRREGYVTPVRGPSTEVGTARR